MDEPKILCAETSSSETQKLKDSDQKSDQKLLSESRDIFTVSFLGFIFMLLLSAFNTSQNMISEIYSQKLSLSYLGNLSMIVIYLVFGVANVFVSKILEFFSYKIAMFVSTWGYILFLLCGALTCSCESHLTLFYCTEGTIVSINLICAAVIGFTAAILWVAATGYVSALSGEDSRAKFFGIFWALAQSSQITGNGLSAFLLGTGSHFGYFMVLFALALISAFLFLLLPQVEKPREQADSKPLRMKVLTFFREVFKHKMLVFSVFMIFSGVVLGFKSGFLYKLVKEAIEDQGDTDLNQKTAYVFVCCGVFEFIGGLACSFFGDKIDRYIIGTVSTQIIEVAIVLTYIAYSMKSYLACFFAAVAWGSGECVALSIITVILTTDMGNTIESFAIYKVMAGVGVIAALGLNLALENQNPNFYFLIITSFEIAGTLSMVYLKSNNGKTSRQI